MKIKTIIKPFISIAIALFFLEILIRLSICFFPRLMPPLYFGGAHPRNLIVPDNELGFTLNPGFQGKETNDYKEYHIDVNISSQGLRDYTHDFSKNIYRILALGDSYTFGEGVELKDTYLSVLENLLKKRYGQDNIEIIKAGLPGYGTKQEVLFLKKTISDFKPNMVILGFLPKETSRLEEPYTYYQGYIVSSKKISHLYLIAGKLYSSRAKNRFFGKLDALIKHCYLSPQFIQSRIKYIRKKIKEKKNVKEKICMIDDLNKKYSLTFSLLKEYKDVCLAHNAQPVIVLIEGNLREDEFIIKFAEDMGIPTLSLYPFFQKYSQDNIPYHFKYDLHWNNTGHRICAHALYEFLVSKNLIKLKPRK